jgi:hypothetical protein
MQRSRRCMSCASSSPSTAPKPAASTAAARERSAEATAAAGFSQQSEGRNALLADTLRTQTASDDTCSVGARKDRVASRLGGAAGQRCSATR